MTLVTGTAEIMIHSPATLVWVIDLFNLCFSDANSKVTSMLFKLLTLFMTNVRSIRVVVVLYVWMGPCSKPVWGWGDSSIFGIIFVQIPKTVMYNPGGLVWVIHQWHWRLLHSDFGMCAFMTLFGHFRALADVDQPSQTNFGQGWKVLQDSIAFFLSP